MGFLAATCSIGRRELTGTLRWLALVVRMTNNMSMLQLQGLPCQARKLLSFRWSRVTSVHLGNSIHAL